MMTFIFPFICIAITIFGIWLVIHTIASALNETDGAELQEEKYYWWD